MEAWPAGPGPGSSGGGASGWGASRVGAPQRSSGSGGSGALWGAQPVLSSSGEAHAHAQRPGSGQRIGRWRVAQLAAVYAAITAHVFVMAYTDPLADPSFVQLLLLFSVQLSLLLGCILAFFLLTTSHSPDVQLGMYHRYFARYRGFYAAAALAVASLSAAGAYRMVLSSRQLPPAAVWAAPGFLPLWVCERSCLLLFQVAAARAAALSLRAPSEPWLAAAAVAGLGHL